MSFKVLLLVKLVFYLLQSLHINYTAEHAPLMAFQLQHNLQMLQIICQITQQLLDIR